MPYKNEEKRKQYRKQYQEENKDLMREYNDKHKDTIRNSNLKRLYGITLEEYNKMFLDQEGKCKICNMHQSELKVALCVDHCHKTGNVRGLLCRLCNSMIGYAKDNKKINRLYYFSCTIY